MSRRKLAAAQRKQAGREQRGRQAGSIGGGKKDAGPSAYFKHRKTAVQAAIQKAIEEEEEQQRLKQLQAAEQDAEGDAAMGDEVESEAGLSAKALGKQKMAEDTDDGAKSLSEGVLQTKQAADEAALAASSFTFTSAPSSGENPFTDPALTGGRDSSLRAYIAQLRKLITESDVLLQVLDARDPMACRSRATETLAMGQGKRIILVLNKIDLVPRDNVEKWLRYLRHDFPTLAFKASTQSQRKNLAQGASSVPTGSSSSSSMAAMSSGSEALGAGALLQLLKNYSRNANMKTSLTVGVFGAPNVGKSSLINSLKRARVCAVAATPGHTKVLQSVMLDKKIRLIDCPGIVFNERAKGDGSGATSKEDDFDGRAAALRNVIKVELLEDPITPIAVILSRVPMAQLETLYALQSSGPAEQLSKPLEKPSLDDANTFLLRLALRKGRLLSGGAPDVEGTARTILQDWNTGKIKYATQPPAIHPSALAAASKAATTPAAAANGNTATSKEAQEKERAAAAIASTSEIKTSFDAEFDLAGLLGLADAEALGGAGDEASTRNAALPAMDTSETPQAPITGRGSLANNKEQKPLLKARQRRFATEADLLPPVAEIEVDAEPEAAKAAAIAADTTANQTMSSLGKRRRFDDSSDEEDEEEEDLTRDYDSEDEDESRFVPPRKQVRAEVDSSFDDSSDLPSWLERQRQKASAAPKGKKGGIAARDVSGAGHTGKMALLATVFSPTELAGLAAPRNAARKKAKKAKRRAEKNSAGGLTDLMDAGLEFDDGDLDEDADESLVPEQEAGIMADRPASKSVGFSALAVDGDEEEEL